MLERDLDTFSETASEMMRDEFNASFRMGAEEREASMGKLYAQAQRGEHEALEQTLLQRAGGGALGAPAPDQRTLLHAAARRGQTRRA